MIDRSAHPGWGLYRNRFFYWIARKILKKPFFKLMDFHGPQYHVKDRTFLLLANHCEEVDCAYEFLSLDRHMRFVASDYIVQKPLPRFLMWFVATPIIKHRDADSEKLVEQILINLHAGISVGVHVEGGRTNTGMTGQISKKNVFLMREAGCPVITYRQWGGYLKHPRWGRNKRKGPVFGEIVHHYSVEEIASLTDDELYERLCLDLSVNEYELQRKNPQKYTAEKPAETAEVILYACPKCRSIASLHSKDNTLRCACGFEASIDVYGFWHGPDLPFDNIVEWNAFQQEVLAERIAFCGGDVPILQDEEQTVWLLKNNKPTQEYQHVLIKLYRDRFELLLGEKTVKLNLKDCRKVHQVSKKSLLIITDTQYYRINSERPRSATKYVDAVRMLRADGLV